MDAVTFLSKLIDAAAWPGTVLILVFKFSDRFRELLGKLTELNLPGGISGKFEPALVQAEAIAEQIEVPEEHAAPVADPIAINANPTGVIMESWIRLTAFADEMLQSIQPNRLSPMEMRARDPIKELERAGELPKEEQTLLRELRLMRNRAAHATDWRPTPDEAQRFVSLVDRIELAWATRMLASMARGDAQNVA